MSDTPANDDTPKVVTPEVAAPTSSNPAAQPDEPDPVAVAAQAIAKFRQRARTDLAELRVHYHQQDIFVVLFALLLMVAAGRLHRRLVTPPTKVFSERGLTFVRSTAWFEPEAVATIAPRLVRSWEPVQVAPSSYHVVFTTTLEDNARFEVLIDDKPAWSNIVTGLEFDRRTRWGELYAMQSSSVRTILGHDWLRTEYQFAQVSEHGDVPTLSHAVEYATVDREQLYVVTFIGNDKVIKRMEQVSATTLTVASQTGLPLVPQAGRQQVSHKPGVESAFQATVMVVSADLINGELKPRGGGSGVVIGKDGSILTNYHVVHDRNGRIHDVFVIARSLQADRAPQLICAGRPSRSKLQPELDMALLKCDMDLDGRQWDSRDGKWLTIFEATAQLTWSGPAKAGQRGGQTRRPVVTQGSRLWVIGFPDVGGGGLTVSQGVVSGFTGQDGSLQNDYIKTDAAITYGNSGGPVVTDDGQLVGIASAFRTKITATGGVVETANIGLVRPVAAANQMISIASAGWTPREGKTRVEFEPTAVEAPAEGVRLATKVTDFSNGQPIAGAKVMILRPGIGGSKIDMNRLDDQVLSWGKSNSLGEVYLKQPVPVPGRYSVAVFAEGYQSLIGDGELQLDANTPAFFDPWGGVTLEAR